VAERPQRLLEAVRTQVEAVLGWPAGERVSVRQGFFDLGMDSLQASELRNRLQAQLGCSLPSTLTFRFPTTAALATHLHEQLFGAPPHPGGDGRTNTPSTSPPAKAAETAEMAETAETSLQHELRQLEQMLGS
jgi:acyl carrier protein